MSILSGTEFITSMIINGVPALQPFAGKIVYVCSVGGINGNASAGLIGNYTGTYTQPFPTLVAAIAYLNTFTINVGDVILVLPGHTETISTATYLSISRKNVQIIGIGSGTSKPQFTYTTAAAATINVTADDVRIVNCDFVANYVSGINALFTPTKKNFHLLGCGLKDTDSTHYFVSAIATSTTDNANDGLDLTGCGITSKSTSGSGMIVYNGNIDNHRLRYNYITTANTSHGFFEFASGKIATNIVCQFNNGFSANTAATGHFFKGLGGTQTANTGIVNMNNVMTAKTTGITLPYDLTGAGLFDNKANGTADVQGILLPVVTSN